MTRRAPSSRSNAAMAIIVALLTVTAVTREANAFPTTGGRELDSAVEGVQKYLESSGFPKMTRGEVVDFLSDFSRNSRVSRSDNNAVTAATTTEATDKEATRPPIPEGESPLNYGYPMSVLNDRPAAVRQDRQRKPSKEKKTVVDVPSVDLNAYAKFKKIPEARNVKIDDEMTEFLSGFGLVDAKPKSAAATTTTTTTKQTPLQRRADDDAAGTETVDELLLRSVLAETGTNVTLPPQRPQQQQQQQQQLASGRRGDHVFNPSDSDLKTVDVNRIAKIVENIRLLTDGNETASLSPDVVQKRLENITADIAAIDRPAASAAVDGAFDGYQVFFDDDTKEVESDDLPESPNAAAVAEAVARATASTTTTAAATTTVTAATSTAATTSTTTAAATTTTAAATTTTAAAAADSYLSGAPNPPDPLSTDELQQLLEKNSDKNDVKRQEPAAAATEDPVAASTSSETVRAQPDSSTSAAATESGPSLSQLADSFGGGETASSPPPPLSETVDEPRDDRPRNGLYFYVDWNSFLTVNQGQKNQVNLRFAPKAGNPAHFLKVNVP